MEDYILTEKIDWVVRILKNIFGSNIDYHVSGKTIKLFNAKFPPEKSNNEIYRRMQLPLYNLKVKSFYSKKSDSFLFIL